MKARRSWMVLMLCSSGGWHCGGVASETPAPIDDSTATSSDGTAGSGGGSEGTRTPEDGNSDAGRSADALSPGGAAGAPPVEDEEAAENDPESVPARYECADFPNPNDQTGCEPKLRAVVSSYALHPVQTYEYDELGRLSSIGTEQPHSESFVHRYTYDAAGRVASYETHYDEYNLESSTVRYDFVYYEDGTLHTNTQSNSSSSREYSARYEYDAEGKLVWVDDWDFQGEVHTYHEYRDDDQLAFIYRGTTREEAMDTTRDPLLEYEYDDDGRLIRIMGTDDIGEPAAFAWFRYGFEGDLLRFVVRSEEESSETTIFDDLGRTAVYQLSLQGEPDPPEFVVNGATIFHAWEDRPYLRELDLVHVGRLFPKELHELTGNDVSNFSYRNDVVADVFARFVHLDAQNRVERLEFTWRGPYSLSIEISRCEGRVLETTRFPDRTADDAYKVYYYGCDDFVLPDRD